MNNAKDLLQGAIARLEYANEELNRPDEDVIALALCQQARSIIGDLFTSYLLLNEKDVSDAHDLETLKQMSVKLDNKFADIDLGEMFCHPGRIHNETGYCMDLGRVRSCVAIANRLKALVVNITASAVAS